MAITKRQRAARSPSLTQVCKALETLAPTHLAQDWDNVGLLAGDRDSIVHRVLLCIDLTPEVVAEALAGGVQLVVAYHPPIFKPIRRINIPSHDMGACVYRCIAGGTAIYSTHTALDAAEGGTNDVIARLCRLCETKPLEYVGGVEGGGCKVVTFVPTAHVEAVAKAMFSAGAGVIGDYEKCSFRTAGTGTFRGGVATHPVVGKARRFEHVEEIRLEAVTPVGALPEVVEALKQAHPYEEPALDIYPLRAVPQRGIGRVGRLSKPIRLSTLAGRLKKQTRATGVQLVGRSDSIVTRAIICVGAAGSLPFKLEPGVQDVIITGEMRHHDALTILRCGCSAIALGHWASERPVLEPFREGLIEQLPQLKVMISKADRDPFVPVRR